MKGATAIHEIQTVKVEKMCPLMSGQGVPVQSNSGIQTGQVQIATMEVPCGKEKCQWWDPAVDDCAMVDVASVSTCLTDLVQTVLATNQRLTDINGTISEAASAISARLLPLEPPQNGPSPIARLADAIEELVDITKDRKK